MVRSKRRMRFVHSLGCGSLRENWKKVGAWQGIRTVVAASRITLEQQQRVEIICNVITIHSIFCASYLGSYGT